MSNSSDRAVGNAWLSFSAIGGFMACLAIPGYMLAVIIPIAFSYFSYINYKIEGNKKKFFLVIVANFIFGLILHFFPHDRNGSLGGGGIVLAMAVLIPSCFIIFKMFKSESMSGSKKSENS